MPDVNAELLFDQIKLRYQEVISRIRTVAESVNRNPNEIRLVVVTKAHSVQVMEAVIAAGATILGENYLEEAIPKMDALHEKAVSWHMIGHIQSRKSRQVCENFDWVHSLDRLKLARRLNVFLAEIEKTLPVILECNVSGEETKFGYPAWRESQWFELKDEIKALIDLSNLEIRGLMTVPPWHPDPEVSRPYYKRLNHLRAYLAGEFPLVNWDELSMGMSNDFEVAIQEGATMLRIGTAILGQRIS